MIRTLNIVLIIVMICTTVWSIYAKNWNVLIANICIIGGVLVEEKTTKLQMKENVNIILIRRIKKYVVPLLYMVGTISLILFAYKIFLNP